MGRVPKPQSVGRQQEDPARSRRVRMLTPPPTTMMMPLTEITRADLPPVGFPLSSSLSSYFLLLDVFFLYFYFAMRLAQFTLCWTRTNTPQTQRWPFPSRFLGKIGGKEKVNREERGKKEVFYLCCQIPRPPACQRDQSRQRSASS